MKSENNLKTFFIKLVAITFSIIIIINVFYNIFLSDKLDVLNKLSSLDKETADLIKDKVRSELKSGLEKEQILSDEDAILIKKFIEKISSENSFIESEFSPTMLKVYIFFIFAVFKASIMFLLCPDVDIAISTSLFLPIASICLENIKSKL